ncbi:DVA-1 polyprotein [Parelaphostrongylus tenuis]|uniref:DVA-1 polyprotein n=1 Tax=Parelaphostrongylus tenuis TaxID=148309 RepID=A0AAD5QUR9_PARTN|nr:DVA-1 polyprotein [Parelaphostrongylus tenuis]
MALRASAACKKIHTITKRFRRDHHHEHTLEEALEKYLTWLTEEQKSEVKTISEGGNREAVYKKVLEFFDAASGETKAKASMELKSACKHYMKDTIGDENVEKIEEMKEKGVSNDEIAAKVQEFIEEITDEKKKAMALRASAACKKIHTITKRFRRDHHHEHTLDEALEKYLTWLTEEQKSEVKTIYEGGNREAVYKKVLEFFDAASGETKAKASMELKSACKHYMKDTIGDENVEKIEEMKEKGVSNDEIAAKVQEFIEEITDEKKKAMALRASAACKKIHTIAKRFRRDHHHEHTLDEALEKYLTWLTEEQKSEVKTIYEGGNREAVYKKVLEFFDAASGETKAKASMELKSACKHYMKDTIGDENVEKIEEMKEKGVSNDEIAAKVQEFIEEITDEKKKAMALRASAACKKIHTITKRFRRDHHHEHTLDEALEKYLTWLTEEQKSEVKTIYEGGNREAVYKKVLEFFDAASGETKAKASMELKSACKTLYERYYW